MRDVDFARLPRSLTHFSTNPTKMESASWKHLDLLPSGLTTLLFRFVLVSGLAAFDAQPALLNTLPPTLTRFVGLNLADLSIPSRIAALEALPQSTTDLDGGIRL